MMGEVRMIVELQCSLVDKMVPYMLKESMRIEIVVATEVLADVKIFYLSLKGPSESLHT